MPAIQNVFYRRFVLESFDWMKKIELAKLIFPLVRFLIGKWDF